MTSGVKAFASGCFAAFLLVVSGAIYFIFFWTSITHEPPEVIGVRKDDTGKVLEEFIYQENVERRGWTLGPHGTVPQEFRFWHHCFIREPGRRERELPFLQEVRFNPYKCYPVAGTALWAVILMTDQPSELRGIVVFDDKHVVHQRIVEIKAEEPPVSVFRDGNHKFIYQSPRGWEAYDVVKDTFAPATKQKMEDE